MKITNIRTTPLFMPYREPYHWAPGVTEGATVLLVEVETDEGIVGIGESMVWHTVDAVAGVIQAVTPLFVGQDPLDSERLFAEVRGLPSAGNPAPRFANHVFAGLEMALWDIVGKAAEQPVHRLLGGAVHQEIQYFGFLQGETAEQLAQHADRLVAAGFPVLYMKVGRGDEADLSNVAAVREAIGDDHRLRLDANEARDTLTAIRMIRSLSRFDPEFVEQPTPSRSIEAMAQAKSAVDIPIAADQSVFTPPRCTRCEGGRRPTSSCWACTRPAGWCPSRRPQRSPRPPA